MRVPCSVEVSIPLPLLTSDDNLDSSKAQSMIGHRASSERGDGTGVVVIVSS